MKYKCPLCGKVIKVLKDESLEKAVKRHARWHVNREPQVARFLGGEFQALSWFFGAIWAGIKRVN
mgnify:CR=1 FL=1